MQHDNYLNIRGLSHDHAQTLRALFDAGLTSCGVPAWVHAAANKPVVQHLQRLGLVGDQGRLTLNGLALAVSLPRPKVKGRRWPLAA